MINLALHELQAIQAVQAAVLPFRQVIQEQQKEIDRLRKIISDLEKKDKEAD